jgi:ATP-dependent DNA helicase DinG
LVDAPDIGTVMAEVERQAEGCAYLVGHNIAFDRDFVRSAGLEIGLPLVDTFDLAHIVYPEARSYNLGSLVGALTGGSFGEHRSLPDTRATVALFLALVSRFETLTEHQRTMISWICAKTSGQSTLDFVQQWLVLPSLADASHD